MTRTPVDTDPDIHARYRSMLRERTPSERMVMAMGMFDAARAVMASSLPQGIDDRTRRIELFVRSYGRDLDQDLVERVVSRLRSNDCR